MKIVNAKVFIGKEFLPGGVEFNDQIIAAGPDVTEDNDALDAKGGYVIPGLVDIHTHGAVGADASDGNPEDIKKLALYYAQGGVTSWCPTTLTLTEDVLYKAMTNIRAYQKTPNGAKVCGINMEGPFVNIEKRGAQNPENIHVPDAAFFNRLNDATEGFIRLVTLAPEEPGSLEFIKAIKDKCRISIGHTTADYDTAKAAYDAGAAHATHLYNGMPSLLHRKPGVIGAAFDAGATVELITDGIHVHPSVIRLTFEMFGDRVCLVSDSLRCAGMPDGQYDIGGQAFTMKDGRALLTGTNTIAGSAIHLFRGMKNCIDFGIAYEKAIYASTTAPADAIGAKNIGRIQRGAAADILVLDRDFNLSGVFIDGKCVVECSINQT